MACSVALGVGGGLEVAQVVVDRELHVHVQHAAAGQQERDVGDRAAGDARLLAVADALDHAGEAQHVVGHALAPLAAGLRAGEGLAQVAGGLGERSGGRLASLRPESSCAVLLGAVAVEPGRPRRRAARPGTSSPRPASRRRSLRRSSWRVPLVIESPSFSPASLAAMSAAERDRVLALHAEARLELGGLLGEQGGLLLEGGGDPLVGGVPAGAGGAGADHVGEDEDGGHRRGRRGGR